jgi:hypothetical protein
MNMRNLGHDYSGAVKVLSSLRLDCNSQGLAVQGPGYACNCWVCWDFKPRNGFLPFRKPSLALEKLAHVFLEAQNLN